jgi:hypothetical protein
MFCVHRYLHELPALGVDPRLPKFVQTVFTQTVVNVGFIFVFVVTTDGVTGDS